MKGRDGKPVFEIPDLDLPPPKPSTSQARLTAVRLNESGERARAPVTTGLSELPEGPALDLDLSAPISGGHSSDLPAHEVVGRAGFQLESMLPEVVGITVAPEGRANWPTGVTSDRALLEFDWNQVQALAKYGAPSSIGALNVFYALRVFNQRRRLRRELVHCEGELARAEAARDELLARLTYDKREELSARPEFRRLLEPLAEIELQGGAHDKLQKVSEQEQSVELNRLDAEVGLLLPELHDAESALKQLCAVQAEREQSLLRLEARHKRSFIELRALEQRGGPAHDVERVRAEQHASLPELEAAKTAYQATLAELEVRSKEQRELRFRIGELERKKRDARARHEQRVAASNKQRGAFASRHVRALGDVGRAVLATRGGVTVDASVIARLREADAAVARALSESEMRVRALDACDRDKLSTGYAWLWASVFVLFALAAYRSLL